MPSGRLSGQRLFVLSAMGEVVWAKAMWFKRPVGVARAKAMRFKRLAGVAGAKVICFNPNAHSAHAAAV